MIDPNEDVGLRQRRGGGGGGFDSDLSISSNGQADVLGLSSVAIEAQPVGNQQQVVRRIVKHKSHDPDNDEEDMSGKACCRTLQPTFHISGIVFYILIGTLFTIFMLLLMPAVYDTKVVMANVKDQMPRLNLMMDSLEILLANKTSEIFDRTISSMDKFSDMMGVLESGVEDPRFQENVQALFSSFVREDLKGAVNDMRTLIQSLQRISDGIKANGMQAQVTIPLSQPESIAPPP